MTCLLYSRVVNYNVHKQWLLDISSSNLISPHAYVFFLWDNFQYLCSYPFAECMYYILDCTPLLFSWSSFLVSSSGQIDGMTHETDAGTVECEHDTRRFTFWPKCTQCKEKSPRHEHMTLKDRGRLEMSPGNPLCASLFMETFLAPLDCLSPRLPIRRLFARQFNGGKRQEPCHQHVQLAIMAKICLRQDLYLAKNRPPSSGTWRSNKRSPYYRNWTCWLQTPSFMIRCHQLSARWKSSPSSRSWK